MSGTTSVGFVGGAGFEAVGQIATGIKGRGQRERSDYPDFLAGGGDGGAGDPRRLVEARVPAVSIYHARADARWARARPYGVQRAHRCGRR